jgi:hypothetical protein
MNQMKKNIIKLSVIALMMVLTIGLNAQNPPHPNGGSSPGSGNTPVGGGAPIDGGLTILLLMSIAYGSKKLIKLNNQENI